MAGAETSGDSAEKNFFEWLGRTCVESEASATDWAVMSRESPFETKLYAIDHLLEAVRSGRVRIPLFQRGFVWNDRDRLQLFDSIANGYPIGTLLFAKGKAPAGSLRLGGYVREVAEQHDALWVLDGQQRLSTLAMSILGDSAGAHRPIFFNLDSNSFVLGPRKREPPPSWVPTALLHSRSSLNRWLREKNLGDELSDRADAIASQFRDSTIPAYVVPYEGDDRVPREIFARINRRGRALTRQQVFDALHTDGATMKPLERVDASLARLGFGNVGVAVIERTAVALLGRSPGALPEHLDLSRNPALPQTVQEFFDRVDESLARAITFLSREADIPHVEWLPYSGALPTLALFFSRHCSPHERNIELLVRWFWRGALSGDHQTNNAIDGERWNAIRSADEHRAVQALLGLLPATPSLGELRLERFRQTTARSKIEMSALYSLGPKMLVGEDQGTDIQPSTLFTEGDDGKPVPWILDKKAGEDKTVACALIHPQVRLDDLRRVPWDEALHGSHAISRDAWHALLEEDWPTFMQIRSAAIQPLLHKFLVERVGLDLADHDHPPLEMSLVEEGA